MDILEFELYNCALFVTVVYHVLPKKVSDLVTRNNRYFYTDIIQSVQKYQIRNSLRNPEGVCVF